MSKDLQAQVKFHRRRADNAEQALRALQLGRSRDPLTFDSPLGDDLRELLRELGYIVEWSTPLTGQSDSRGTSAEQPPVYDPERPPTWLSRLNDAQSMLRSATAHLRSRRGEPIDQVAETRCTVCGRSDRRRTRRAASNVECSDDQVEAVKTATRGGLTLNAPALLKLMRGATDQTFTRAHLSWLVRAEILQTVDCGGVTMYQLNQKGTP